MSVRSVTANVCVCVFVHALRARACTITQCCCTACDRASRTENVAGAELGILFRAVLLTSAISPLSLSLKFGSLRESSSAVCAFPTRRAREPPAQRAQRANGSPILAGSARNSAHPPHTTRRPTVRRRTKREATRRHIRSVRTPRVQPTTTHTHTHSHSRTRTRAAHMHHVDRREHTRTHTSSRHINPPSPPPLPPPSCDRIINPCLCA